MYFTQNHIFLKIIYVYIYIQLLSQMGAEFFSEGGHKNLTPICQTIWLNKTSEPPSLYVIFWLTPLALSLAVIFWLTPLTPW